MNTVGQKIKEIRKRKGFSQEELAEVAKVNLRTIQRIENNESEPRGATLNLICDALEINSDDIFDYGKKEDKGFIMLFHLSVLSFAILPLGNIIIPLILWVSKKDKIIGLNSLGANVINFQIVLTAVGCSTFILFLITQQFFFILILLLIILLAFLLPLALFISAYKGKDSFYPTIIKLVGE